MTSETKKDDGGRHVATWPDPAQPSALLLPQYVRDNLALKTTKRWLIIGLVAVSLVMVATTAITVLVATQAADKLTAAETERDQLQHQVTQLQPVADFYDGLESRRQAVAAALATDVEHSALFDLIRSALPGASAIESYNATFTNECPNADPFTAVETLGCIQFEIKTNTTADAARFVANLESNKKAEQLMSGLLVTDVQSDGKGHVTYTARVSFTSAALSQRYTAQEDEQ